MKGSELQALLPLLLPDSIEWPVCPVPNFYPEVLLPPQKQQGQPVMEQNLEN